MTHYRRISLYRFRWLRRIRYGRGRGVHSPKAYRMVQMLVRPYARYYHFDEYYPLFRSPLHQLIYRSVARVPLRKVVLIDQDKSVETIVRLASSSVPITNQLPHDLDRVLVVTSNIVAIEITDSTYLIFTDIRKTKESARVFKKWVGSIPQGIVLDLYDTALVAGMDKVKYVYRTTL